MGRLFKGKWDIHPSHSYNSWMVFLISSMAATINLNTSLNQHSLPWSLSFTSLYVKVLLCVRVIQSGICERLCHLHYYDFRHSLNVFFWTINEIYFLENLGTFKINYFLPKLLESYGIFILKPSTSECNGVIEKPLLKATNHMRH